MAPLIGAVQRLHLVLCSAQCRFGKENSADLVQARLEQDVSSVGSTGFALGPQPAPVRKAEQHQTYQQVTGKATIRSGHHDAHQSKVLRYRARNTWRSLYKVLLSRKTRAVLHNPFSLTYHSTTITSTAHVSACATWRQRGSAGNATSGSDR